MIRDHKLSPMVFLADPAIASPVFLLIVQEVGEYSFFFNNDFFVKKNGQESRWPIGFRSIY